MLEKRGIILIALFVILMITIPYFFAFQQNTDDFEFGGFLINPVDGHSYLAKMEIGNRGEWKFDLPYTAEAGSGAYLFLFYIFLGHAARIIGVDNILVFHMVRVFFAVVLILSIHRMYKRIFIEEIDQNLALIITMIGSGLGWIAVLRGMFTSDLWVAEAYPFLSAYTNPHFTLGLAIAVWALAPGNKQGFMLSLASGLLLAIVQPFAVVIVLLVMAGTLVSDILTGEGHSVKDLFGVRPFWSLIGFGLGGGIYLIYQYSMILTDPVLSLWNVQNQTPSPGLLDLLISFSPCLILAAIGAPKAWKSNSAKYLVIWSVVSLVLLAIPWNLQRRFMTGLFLPLAGLSIFGLKIIAEKGLLKIQTGFMILIIMAVPTNLIVIFSGISAAADRDPAIYLSRPQFEVLDWIEENADPGALVLTGADLGLYIPSLTGRRVIYGHPFETINADHELGFLNDFFGSDHDPVYYEDEVNSREVDLIIQTESPENGFLEWVAGSGIEIKTGTGEYIIYQILKDE